MTVALKLFIAPPVGVAVTRGCLPLALSGDIFQQVSS